MPPAMPHAAGLQTNGETADDSTLSRFTSILSRLEAVTGQVHELREKLTRPLDSTMMSEYEVSSPPAGGRDIRQASLRDLNVEVVQEFSREKHNLEEISSELIIAAQMVEDPRHVLYSLHSPSAGHLHQLCGEQADGSTLVKFVDAPTLVTLSELLVAVGLLQHVQDLNLSENKVLALA